MSRILLSFVLALALIWASPAASQDGAVAFVGANVIPMTDDEVRPNWTVVVSGSRITAAGPASEVDVPPSARRIDASGKYLIPGLAEMHGHVPSPNDDPQYLEDIFFMYVANGITTVRGMLGSPGQLEVKARANRGEIVAPSLYLAGPPFSGGSVSSPEDAAARVSQQAAEGWDYLKVLPGLTREEYDAMAERSAAEGIPMIGHVPSDVGLEHALEKGQQTIDHIDGYIDFVNGGSSPLERELLQRAVDATVDAGVWLVPTMALWETILGVPTVEEVSAYPELRYMPPDIRQNWLNALSQRRSANGFDQGRAEIEAENRIRILAALNDAGARILMGTDSPQQYSVPGFSLKRELPLMAAAGMTPYEILASGTSEVGEYFADKDSFGTIEPGRRADLILLHSNPLENAMNVFDRAGVMVQGRWLDADTIEQGLDAIASGNQ